MKKIIIIVLALFVILGFIFWKFGPALFSGGSKGPTGPVKLTYWGLWEEGALMKGVIAEYQKTHPNVQIEYTRQPSLNYKSRLQTQIKDGSGPDIFRIHNTWVPQFPGYLYPAPLSTFSVSDYESTFYPVAKDSFVSGQYVYAAPVGIDGLAMYVNEEIVTNAGRTIPTTWQEFINTAYDVTVTDPNTNAITTAGAALGTASNVDNFSDILGLLLLQQAVDIKNPQVSEVALVLRFYTGFSVNKDRKTWDKNLPSSTQAFAQGRVAFYFAPSWRAQELRTINPQLNFKVVPVPQLPEKQIGWASFWGEAVSAKSKYPKEAWEFVKYLTSADAEKLMYQEASKVRLFGEPYSRVDLADQIKDAPIVGTYITQGPYYKSWYLASGTFDDPGINSEMIKYWEDGVNNVLNGQSPETAADTVVKGIQQVLAKYTQPAPSPTKK